MNFPLDKKGFSADNKHIMEPKDRIKDLMEELSGKGVRWTIQRYAVLEYLYTHRTHPTAEEIFRALKRQFPAISKATVYNTLELLKQYGLVRELYLEKERARYDFEVAPHFHLVCRSCGGIYDLDLSAPSVPKEVDGHVVEDVMYCAFGVCAECRSKAEQQEALSGPQGTRRP